MKIPQTLNKGTAKIIGAIEHVPGTALVLVEITNRATFVTAQINAASLSEDEWYGGNYFDNKTEAVVDFCKRLSRLFMVAQG